MSAIRIRCGNDTRRRSRGDAGATWLILCMFVVIGLGAAWFYLASVANSDRKRQVQTELDRKESELEDARLAARRELTRIRGLANEASEVVDGELDEARDELGAQREIFREQRHRTMSLEAEAKAMEGEFDGLEQMAADVGIEIARLEEDEARIAGISAEAETWRDADESDRDATAESQLEQERQREPTREPGDQAADDAIAAQALIEATILEVGHVLDERDLLVAPDSGVASVMADGFLLRDHVSELKNASTAERKAASENLRRAALEVQSKIVMARVKLRKVGVRRFESAVLDELTRMQEALTGAPGGR